MNSLSGKIAIIFVCLLALGSNVQAKKYRPVNEIPGQVPETEEEQGIWQVGIAHQKQVRGTDELLENDALEKYLEGIVSRLMGDMVEQIGLEVDVLIFRDPTVNAWVYPNGTVAVQTGLLAAMDNEAQLAAILGHEVSHFLNRHAFIQIKAKQKQSVLGKGLGVIATAALAAKTGQLNTGLLSSGQIWTDLVTSGYSRKLETAADTQGLQLMINAGYPPEQAIPAFEEMRQADDDVIDVSKMWSSHPDIDARKKNLNKQIRKNKLATRNDGLDAKAYLQAVRLAALSNSQLQVTYRDFDKAITRLRTLTETLDNDASGLYLLGEAYRKQDYVANRDKIIASYQKSTRAKADFAEPWRELGMAYRQQGDAELAREAFDNYLRLASGAPDGPIISWYRDNLAASLQEAAND